MNCEQYERLYISNLFLYNDVIFTDLKVNKGELCFYDDSDICMSLKRTYVLVSKYFI